MKATQFTTEQESALQSLEQAIASQDLHAVGHTRKHQAHQAVAYWFKQVERLGVADALTASEMATCNQARAALL